MTIASDYDGRTVDLSVFHWTNDRGEIALIQRLTPYQQPGRQVVGVLRMAQRFLLSLLTPRGSLRHYPLRGSTLLLELRAGSVRTVVDLMGAVSRSLIDVRRDMAADERSDDPLDERYGGSKIQRVELSAGTAKIWLDLRSRDPAARVLLPLDVSLVSH